MKAKKIKKLLLITLLCIMIPLPVSAESDMESQLNAESKNYDQLEISERRVYGEYPTGA